MKKLIALVLALVTVLSLAACGEKKPADAKPDIHDVPEKKSYAGMSAVFVGDSITNGAELEKGDKIYWQIVSENLKMGEITGMGVNGSCYSAKSEFGLDHEPLISRYQKIPQADLIFIALGCNDFGRNTPMGTIEDKEDISFYGAMNYILDQLAVQCPDSQIVLLTPIPRPNRLVNDLNLKLRDYADAIIAVGQARQIPVVDMLTLVAPNFPDGLLVDGVHPDKFGHEVMAQTLQTWLEENVETLGK